MLIHGRCLCGQITYTSEIDPRRVFICHCTDCQTQSGTTFRTVAIVSPSQFTLESGEPSTYARRGDSGTTRVLAFCPNCGTSIYGGPAEGEDGMLSLRVGTVVERTMLRPAAQLWCRSAQTWLGDLAEIPQVQEQR
jgi:hypothetical protein